MILDHERNYDLDIDALVASYIYRSRTELWFGHRYSGHHILPKKNICVSLDGKVTRWLILLLFQRIQINENRVSMRNILKILKKIAFLCGAS